MLFPVSICLNYSQTANDSPKEEKREKKVIYLKLA